MPVTARSAWDAFVENHPAGTVFHTTRWLDILWKSFRRPYYHIASLESSQVRGVVSLSRVRGLSGRTSLYSLPYTAYGGMLTDNSATSEVLQGECTRLAQQTNAGMVHLRNTHPTGLNLPGTDLHVKFAKALPASEAACLESIPRKSRATVRKAMTNYGLTYIINKDWERLWELSAINLKKLGTPAFPKSFFRIIMEEMGEHADILFVMQNGRALCGVMTFYFKNICNPYFSGSLNEAGSTGANNYMYYALMCHGLKRGCREFDFGKSRRGSGSFDFKKNMGFEPYTLPFQYIFNTQTHLPDFNPSNPKLALFLKLWSRQPLWTSKIVGPLLNRFLP